jgi:hypothetical protein
MRSNVISGLLSAACLLLLAAGCESDDQRLVDLAIDADQRQADQNRQIAHQNHELAEAANRLIAADAESRKELVALERDLQAERSAIGRERDELEGERRQIAAERHWDSVAGEAVSGGALLIGAILPLALCWFVLRGLWQDTEDDGLGEVLAEELTSDSPAFMPSGPPNGGLHLPRSPIDD